MTLRRQSTEQGKNVKFHRHACPLSQQKQEIRRLFAFVPFGRLFAALLATLPTMTASPLATLAAPTPDAIFAIAAAAKAAGPQAINGTVGIYMDEDGKPMMLPSVRNAMEDVRNILATRSYSYPPLTGLPEFRACVHTLIAGKDDPRIASIATTGGTGAVALNLRLAKLLQKDPTVIFPSPTWANHKQLCDEAGMRVIDCAFLKNGRASADGILDALKKTPAPAVVLLHAGCHNPTGLDLDRTQWETLLPALRDAGAVALMDFAYQGFASTPEKDAWPVRRAVELGVTTLVCWSASKNHSIYSERVGLAAAFAPDDEAKKKIEGHYMVLTRKIHSAAATFGQSVVAQVQSHHRDAWLKDLEEARATMEKKRRMLLDAVPDFAAALSGFGMFAVLPLTPQQIERLKTEHLVFLTGDGRINIAGIPLSRIEELAQKIATVAHLRM